MWLDKESQIDLLAYSPFAELITNITANERLNPLTIGLFGRWGAGKSTSAIMESLLRTLMDNQPAFEGLKDEIRSLIGRINFMKLGATAIKHGMPLVMSAINPATATLTMAQYFSKAKKRNFR